MRKVPFMVLIWTDQVKREINKQKLTEEWGCETGTGAAFLGSKILIWIVTVTASGYGKSGTCSGFWKKTAREIRRTSFRSNIQGSFFSPEGCFPLPLTSWDSPHCTVPGLRAWIGSWPRARARSWPWIGARRFWRSWIGPGGWTTSAFRPTARPRRPTAQTKAEKLQWNSLEMLEKCKCNFDQTEITQKHCISANNLIKT